MRTNQIYQGKALEVLKTFPSESIDMVMTSPPYWALRDYGIEGQLGLEPSPDEYIRNLCDIFDIVNEKLKKEGTCWVNLGDTYSANRTYQVDGTKQVEGSQPQKQPQAKDYGMQEKSLCLIPERFVIGMVKRNWILRNTIIWQKPNCMPSSAKDRFTVDFEKIFFFSKSKKYHFERQLEDIRGKVDPRGNNRVSYNIKTKNEWHKPSKDAGFLGQDVNGRNKRCVWRVNTKPYSEAHFAVYPEELCETPIKAGCPKGGIVLDPFFGAGTTGLVALKLDRKFIGIELNPDYIKISEKRLKPYLGQTMLNTTKGKLRYKE